MPDPTHEFTLSQVIAQLDSGAHWTQSQLGYGFATAIPAGGFPNGESTGLTPFNGDQRAAARMAISLWEDLINIDFVEPAEASADILFVNYTNAGQAYAYFPPFGDVFINPNQSSNFQLDPGGYGLLTLVHELGHSLGLNHPGNYDAGRGAVLSYRDQAEYEQDSLQYTVMSYWAASNTGANHGFNNYAATPLLHDIATIQAIYGANQSTRTGDTVYGFNSTADRIVFDFSSRFYTQAPIVSIWDAGGTDTLDVSGFANNANIDLNDGAFSDVGGLTANVSIAFNAFIENAVGGSGNDQIIGQELDNRLDGGAGNDILTGAGGNDELIGGTGNDTARYSGVVTSYTITDLGNSQYSITGDDGTDSLSSIEFLQFGSGAALTIEDAIRAADGTTATDLTTVTDDTTDGDADPVVTSDSNDTLATAAFISLDVTLSGYVGFDGDPDDFYTFTAASSGTLTASLTGLAQDIDLYFVNSGGTLVGQSNLPGTSAESLSYDVTAGSTYFFNIHPYLDAQSSYTLTASIAASTSSDASDTLLGAAWFALPTSLTGSVGFSGDVSDFFQIRPDSDGELHVTLTGLSQDIDLFVLDSVGGFLASSLFAGASSEEIFLNVTAGSTYYVNVDPFLSAQSEYALTIDLQSSGTTTSADGNDSLSTAADISLPGTVSQTIGFSGDENDYFKFTASAAGLVTVELQGLSADIDLEFLDSAGALLSFSVASGSANESLAYAVTAGETYYVRVYPYLDNESTYELITSFSTDLTATDAGDTIATAVDLTLGSEIVQDIGGTDLVDFYRLETTSNGLLWFNMSGLSADIDMFLYDSNQTLIGTSFLAGTADETIELTVTQGETYFLEISPWESAQSSYTLIANISDSVTTELVTYTAEGRIEVEYDGIFETGIVSFDSATGVITINGPAGQGTLTDVDRVIFSDGSLAFDLDGNAGQTYRLYQAAFGRTPDVPGLTVNVGVVDDGLTLKGLSGAFLVSAEFVALYGADSTVDTFLTALYANVLNRAPDQAGFDSWNSLLESGQLDRADVLIGFSESGENITLVGTAIEDGIWLA
ncbi:MAG: M10 family metallopeptidase C-terminal domain-containing protein [Alphaproteobacteria bacterium]